MRVRIESGKVRRYCTVFELYMYSTIPIRDNKETCIESFEKGKVPAGDPIYLTCTVNTTDRGSNKNKICLVLIDLFLFKNNWFLFLSGSLRFGVCLRLRLCFFRKMLMLSAFIIPT